MHNIKEIRNNLDLFKSSLKKRFLETDFDKILELDEKNRKLIQEKENLEKEKKDISKSKDKTLFKKSKDVSVEIDKLSKTQLEIKNKLNRDLVNVFVPTTPNPTSGFLLMYPKEDLIYLDMTFEEASKFIVSAGTSNPS